MTNQTERERRLLFINRLDQKWIDESKWKNLKHGIEDDALRAKLSDIQTDYIEALDELIEAAKLAKLAIELKQTSTEEKYRVQPDTSTSSTSEYLRLNIAEWLKADSQYHH